MRIVLKTEDLRTIFSTCKNFVSKDDLRPPLKGIKLEIQDGKCVAVATDSYKVITVSVPVQDYTASAKEHLVIPIIKLPDKKESYITIIEDETVHQITFTFVGNSCTESKQTVRKYDGSYVTLDKNFFSVQEGSSTPITIGVNPQKLEKALNSFKDSKVVTLTFSTSNKSSPFLIQDKENPDRKAMLYPVILARDTK